MSTKASTTKKVKKAAKPASNVTTPSDAEQAAEYLEGWQRARAELANFKKSVAAEAVVSRERHLREVLTQLLPVADNFRLMIAQMPEDSANNAWAQGVHHVGRQLDDLLTEFGVEPIVAEGKPFDPAQHDAVAVEGEHTDGEGVVTEVVQVGYMHGDALIRPAKVKIAYSKVVPADDDRQ